MNCSWFKNTFDLSIGRKIESYVQMNSLISTRKFDHPSVEFSCRSVDTICTSTSSFKTYSSLKEFCMKMKYTFMNMRMTVVFFWKSNKSKMYWGKRLINLSFSKKSWFWPRNRANEAYIFLCLLLTVRDIHTLLHEQQGGGLAACLKKSTLKCVVCSWLLQIHLNCVTKHLFRKLISWHGMMGN